MKKIAIIVGVVLVLGLGAIVLANNDDQNKDTAETNTPTTNQTSGNSASNNNGDTPVSSSDGTTITYNGSSFSPSRLSVKAGTEVTIVNNSDRELEFSSDPHPVHTDNPELNESAIKPGETKTIKPTKTGTWGFHDHLNSSVTGTLVVE